MDEMINSVMIYKICGRDLNDIEDILRRDNYEKTDYEFNIEGNDLYIYQKHITQQNDYALPFLSNNVSIKRYVYIILIPDLDNDKNFYWFRRGSDRSRIDSFKNSNFAFHYLANCRDHGEYNVVSSGKIEFSTFSGESRTSIIKDKDMTKLSDIKSELNTYKESIDDLVLKVKKNSQIYDDLCMDKTREVRISNGIKVYLDMSSDECFRKAFKICKNISKRQRNGEKTNVFRKIRKSNVVIDSEIKVINLFELKKSSDLDIEYVENSANISSDKNYFGIFSKDDIYYYINIKQEKYKMDFNEEKLSEKLNTEEEKRILELLNVNEYKNEADYIGKIKNVNNEDCLVHVFHPKHYCHTSKSKFELCDVLLYDKSNDNLYLIFIKYEFLAKSSEVFWQSTFVKEFILKDKLSQDKLERYYDNAGFRYSDYRKKLFLDKANFVNIILPRGNNRSTDNLDHVYTLVKHIEGRERLKIIVPETTSNGNSTRIEI